MNGYTAREHTTSQPLREGSLVFAAVQSMVVLVDVNAAAPQPAPAPVFIITSSCARDSCHNDTCYLRCILTVSTIAPAKKTS